jgi:hypothetical protein
MKVPYKTHLKKAEEMDAIVSPISAVPGHDPSRNYIYRLFKAKAGSKSGKTAHGMAGKGCCAPVGPIATGMIRNFLDRRPPIKPENIEWLENGSMPKR